WYRAARRSEWRTGAPCAADACCQTIESVRIVFGVRTARSCCALYRVGWPVVGQHPSEFAVSLSMVRHRFRRLPALGIFNKCLDAGRDVTGKNGGRQALPLSLR